MSIEPGWVDPEPPGEGFPEQLLHSSLSLFERNCLPEAEIRALQAIAQSLIDIRDQLEAGWTLREESRDDPS